MLSMFDIHLDLAAINYLNTHYDVSKMDISEYCKTLDEIKDKIAHHEN